jgi:hypothetical protein
LPSDDWWQDFRDRLMIDLDNANNMHLLPIHRTHDSIPGGHLGKTKTFDLMDNTCLWCDKTKSPQIQLFSNPLPMLWAATRHLGRLHHSSTGRAQNDWADWLPLAEFLPATTRSVSRSHRHGRLEALPDEHKTFNVGKQGR